MYLLELMLLTSAALWPAQAEEMQSWQSLEKLATLHQLQFVRKIQQEKRPRSFWKGCKAPVVPLALPSTSKLRNMKMCTASSHLTRSLLSSSVIFCHLLSKPWRGLIDRAFTPFSSLPMSCDSLWQKLGSCDSKRVDRFANIQWSTWHVQKRYT